MPDIAEQRRIFAEYARGQGMHVNDGIKYGLDFLVYTDDPSRVHSKYGVLIHREMTYQALVCYQRICSSNNKKLLIVRVGEDRRVAMEVYERLVLSAK